MRKLGKGQSVVFCSSLEVQCKILEYKSGSSIEVADILAWCIANTCALTKKSIPLRTIQGLRHQDRQAKCSRASMSPALVEALLEPEAQTLQQRYGHEDSQHEDQILRGMASQTLVARKKQIDEICAKCQDFEIQSLNTAALQEEQERELSPENEREQQVELPPQMKPCRHSVHPEVWRLVQHGKLNRSSGAFQPAFGTLRDTTAHKFYEVKAWPVDLLVTTDFANTVCAAAGESLDSFLRPVHWVLSCRSTSGIKYVVVSPYEAQELLPCIRQSREVTLHVYSPRSNFSVRTLEDLSFCAIPPVPQTWSTPIIAHQLNLFAGQLYIRNYEDYTSLCRFLGLCSSVPKDQTTIACDGFISLANRTLLGQDWDKACPFETSPVAFIRSVIAFRRKGQSTTVSHIGQILNGELVSKEQFKAAGCTGNTESTAVRTLLRKLTVQRRI
jgi:hypothetical protein